MSGRHRARRGAAAASGFALVAASAVSALAGFGVSAADAATLPANCAQASVGADVVCTFTYTGAEQTFTVPDGVTSVDLAAVGASGGALQSSDGAGPGGTASVSGYAVTAGQKLYVEVGGTGSNGGYAGSAGGFNGGGAGGSVPAGDEAGAGPGGGGASDVRTVASGQAGSLASRAVVASGGGGGFEPSQVGGGPGQAGSTPTPGANGGGGGTGSAGGAGGTSSSGNGSAGGQGTGGAGQSIMNPAYGGGGGGGGYYGGGGGSLNAPGGGGSNYPAPGGTADGPAQVTISYAPPGPATGLVLDPATDTATAGTAITYHAYTVDAAGATLADVTASTAFSSGAGSCTGAVCTLTKAGTDSVTGVDGELSGSASVTVTPGPATGTSWTGGNQSTAVDTAFGDPLAVTVQDDYGNPISGMTFTFTVTSGSAAFPGGVDSAKVDTDANGTATSPTLTAGGTPGPVTVTVTASGFPSPIVIDETVTGIAPAFTADAPPDATAGGAYSYAFTATGVPGPTYAVSAGSLPPGLSLSGAGVLSGTPTSAGIYQFEVTASNGIGPDAVTSQLTITVAPGPGATVAASAGAGQSATVDTAFPTALAALVTDAFGDPVPGVTVTFTVSSGSAAFPGGTSASATTGTSGVATAPSLTAGGTPGPVVVQAAAEGVSAPVSFDETVAGIAPAFTADTPPGTAVTGTSYSYTFTATGTPAPTFTVGSGSLPDGLALDPTTGVLSGTPAGAGSSTFTVTASNTAGKALSASITIAVHPAAAPTTTQASTAATVSPAATSTDLAETGVPTRALLTLAALLLLTGTVVLRLGHGKRT